MHSIDEELTCLEFRDQALDYARWEAHLAECEACQEFYAEETARANVLGALGAEGEREPSWEAILQHVHAQAAPAEEAPKREAKSRREWPKLPSLGTVFTFGGLAPRWAVASLMLLAIAAFGSTAIAQLTRPVEVKIASGPRQGGWTSLVQKMKRASEGAKVQNFLGGRPIQLKEAPSSGVLDNIGRLDLHLVDMAFWQSGVPTLPSTEVRLVARIPDQVMQVLVRNDPKALPVRGLEDIKARLSSRPGGNGNMGRIVCIGSAQGGTSMVSRQLLAAYGWQIPLEELEDARIDTSWIRPHPTSDTDSDKYVSISHHEAVRLCNREQLDAVFFVTQQGAPGVTRIMDTGEYTLTPARSAQTPRLGNGLRRSVIPAGAMGGRVARDVPTFSVPAGIIARTDAPEAAVAAVVRALDRLGYTQRLTPEEEAKGVVYHGIPWEQPEKLNGIPMHPVAARYYRNQGRLASGDPAP